MAVRHYFLGANTGGGFVSVYDEFCPPECGVFLWVLKGGPGCGKSSFMKAYDELRQAKALHDELESVYNPHVDFDGVYKLAEDHIQKIKKSHCKPAENGVE